MRRLLASILAGLVLGTVASGCGGPDGAPDAAPPAGEIPAVVEAPASVMTDAALPEAALLIPAPAPVERVTYRRADSMGPRVAREASISGCGKALPSGLKAGTTTARTLASGGITRQYRVHVPAGATNAKRMPLVLNLHGRSGNSADQELYSGLVPYSDKASFLLVSPDGTGTPTGWSAGATPRNSVDDVRFFNDLLDALEGQLCVDAARVYATGFSNGAFMASRLACELPDRIAAVAVVGGLHFPGASCAAPVPLLAFHGTADAVVPIEGGPVRAWQYTGAYDAMARWSANNGCAGDPEIHSVSAGTIRSDYASCRATTTFIVIGGAAHIWPGSPLLPAAMRADVNAAEMIAAFFADKYIG